MAARQCRPIERNHLQVPAAVPVAGFLVALAAALLQAGWWFAHGWTWSNLATFLASGRPVVWCVMLILVGASLSWLGLRRAERGLEGRDLRERSAGRGWAVAGLAASGLAAVPIMPEVLLLTILLLTLGTVVRRRSPPSDRRRRPGRSTR